MLAFLGVVKPADIDAMHAFHDLWLSALREDGLSWPRCLSAAVAGTLGDSASGVREVEGQEHVRNGCAILGASVRRLEWSSKANMIELALLLARVPTGQGCRSEAGNWQMCHNRPRLGGARNLNSVYQ